MSTSSGSSLRSKLTVECLEDRTVPTFLPRTGLPLPAVANGTPLPPLGQGGQSIAIGSVFPTAKFGGVTSQYVIGTGVGIEDHVLVFDVNGNLLSQFVPFAGFLGGINVAVGDVLGLGSNQIVVTEAAGGVPIVGVFSGSGQMLNEFFANGNTTFTGGLNVAVGHVEGGIMSRFNNTVQFPEQIILGTASVLPAVVVTNGQGNVLQSFFAFAPNSGVGVTVASADIDTSPTPGSGFGFGGPDTNAFDEIIVGAASKAPAVAVFDVWQGVRQRELFFAFDTTVPTNLNGVTVAAGTTSGSRGAQIYVALVGSSTVRAFAGQSGALLAQFTVYPPTYSQVVNLAVGHIKNPLNVLNNGASDFDSNDLAVVAGDGPFLQVPRLFFGAFPGQPGPIAGLNGP
jgi:hypothetical protein